MKGMRVQGPKKALSLVSYLVNHESPGHIKQHGEHGAGLAIELDRHTCSGWLDFEAWL